MRRMQLSSMVRASASRLLPLVPRSVRARILRSTPLARARRWFLAENGTWWDRHYAALDVAEFEANPRERLKFVRTLEAVGDGPFDRALEIGCGPGIFSRMLASQCREFRGIDISSVAVAKANERLASVPNAHAEVGSLPNHLPDGPFDLVVCSDTLFYLSKAELPVALASIEARLAPGGSFVAAHHRRYADLGWTGDEIHRAMRELLHLHHDEDLGDATFAIDRYHRPARDLVPVMADEREPARRRTVIRSAAAAVLASALHAIEPGLVVLA